MNEIAVYCGSELIGHYSFDAVYARIKSGDMTMMRPSRTGQRRAALVDSRFRKDLESFANSERNIDAGNFTAHYEEPTTRGSLVVLKKLRKGRLVKWTARDQFTSTPIRMFASLERRMTKLFPPMARPGVTA